MKRTISSRLILQTFLISTCLAASAIADVVVWRNTDGRPGNEFKDVRILRVQDGALVYLSGGNERSREIDRVYRITLNDDPTLNDAETAFIEGKFAQAVDSYQRVVRGQQEWKRKYALPRLLQSAQQSGRFDAAVTAFIMLLRTEGVEKAGAKPEIAAGVGAGMLDAAAKELDQTISQLPQSDALKQPLLSLLLDVQRSRNDAQGVSRTLDQLLQLVGPNQADPANADPAMQALIAQVRLDQAQVALDKKDFTQVEKLLSDVSPLLGEPQQQIKALDLRARAAELQAGTDEKKLTDAALAYLRIVAHFTAEDERPARDAATLSAAGCLERAGDLESAQTLLKQLIAETPESTQIAAAKIRLAAIEAKIKPK